MKVATLAFIVVVMLGALGVWTSFGFGWPFLVLGEAILAVLFVMFASIHGLKEGEAALVGRPRTTIGYGNYRVYTLGEAICFIWGEKMVKVPMDERRFTFDVNPEDPITDLGGSRATAILEVICGITDATHIPRLVTRVSPTLANDVTSERLCPIVAATVEQAMRNVIETVEAAVEKSPDLVGELKRRIASEVSRISATFGLSTSTRFLELNFPSQ